MDNEMGKASGTGRPGSLRSGLERLFFGRRPRGVNGLEGAQVEVHPDVSGGGADPAGFPRRKASLPAGHAQRQLWFLNRMNPGDDAYHMSLSLRIKGHMDVSALQAALQVMLERHESLRSVFLEEDGELIIRVLPDVRAKISREDLSALRDEEKERKAAESSEAFLRKPFDLGSDPPIRSLLIRLSDREHVFIFVVHHIAADGGSLTQFARQLSDYYNQQVRQGRIRWSPLPGRSTQWGAEERAFLHSAEAAPMLEFWRRELSLFSREMPWPFAPPLESSRPSPSGLGTLRMAPDALLARDLMAYERQDSGRMFRFLLASLFALLHRLSGEDTVTVGVPVHDRRNSDEREMIGLRMKLVPVTVRFGDDARFSDILKQLNIKFREILKNLRVPLGALSEWLPFEREEAAGRLFHTFFNYREDVVSSIRLEGLEVCEHPVSVAGAKSDLSIVVEAMPDYAKWMHEGILLKYDRSRFREEDVRSMAERWFMLMSLFLRSPDVPMGSVGILLPGEEELLRGFEKPSAETGPVDACLHGLFRSQAAATPGAAALIDGDSVTSYSELDRMSDLLAKELLHRGVGRDVTVAIRCDRGSAMVVAMLGVLKAGGAFLPVDPDDPPGRVRRLLTESGTRFMVADRSHAVELVEGVETVVVEECLHSVRKHTAATEQEVQPSSDPVSLAYLMFTSGSTGRPKGVMVEHRHIVNRILFMRRHLGFGPEDRTLFKSSPSFDVSLGEVFLPLLSGGAVVIPRFKGAMDPAALAESVALHRVTYLHFVPAMLRAYLDAGHRPGVEDGIRVVWCGGDVLPNDLMRHFLSVSPARLVHGYGPTEAAVGVTVWECRYDHPHSRPPIGRPIENTYVRVVDGKGRRLPPGMAGEIWIGGAQVARGYLGDEPLTRLRFIADPEDPVAGTRFYRSGDKGAWLPDGELLFLGRIDGQLKIRGRRVEPGETEAAILQQPGVLHAHVSGESDGTGELGLVAWVSVDPGAFEGMVTMHKRLSAVLPSHLMPSVVRPVDVWPVDRRGKTDVKALLRMSSNDRMPVPRMPSDGGERSEVVRSVWEETLGSTSHDRDADFFRSGGHSMLALRLIALIRERLGVRIRLADFYRSPTLSALQSLVCGDARTAGDPLAAMAVPEGPVPMSHGQRRMWLIDASSVHPAAYNILRVVRVDGKATAESLTAILRRLMHRHGILCTRLVSEGGRLLQVVESPDDLKPTFRELTLTEESLPVFLTEERDRVFELGRAPLWRACLVHTRRADLLCLVFHHAVTDEHSASLFLSDFERLSASAKEGVAVELPMPVRTYAHFAVSQTDASDTDRHARSLCFWKNRLADVSDAPVLEPDFAAVSGHRGRSAEATLELDEGCTRHLEQFARKEGVSLAVVLLAGFGILLDRVGGRRGGVMGMTVSERQGGDWDDVMGFFLNTLPIRTSAEGEAGFRSVCRRLKWEVEEALAHADVPYEEILHAAGDEDGKRLKGLARILFNMHAPSEGGGRKTSFGPYEPSLPPYARHELACHARKEGNRIALRWVYDAGLFKGKRMQAMLRRYALLLGRMVASPDTPVCLHPLLLSDEKAVMEETVLDDNAYAYPKKTLHGLVRSMALERPGDTAVISESGTMTFAALDRLSDRVARRLLSLGVERGEPVGVVAHRCLELPALLLGVVKAGAAFMPIDPSEPTARLRTMVGLSGMRILLVSQPCAFRTLKGVRVAEWRDLSGLGETVDEKSSLPQVGPNEPAYVIHTSGSTGAPKGVVVSHGNISARLLSVRDLFGLGPADRSLLKTPMSFDVAVTEAFQTLVCGGSVVVADPQDPVAAGRLTELVCRHGVSYLHFTPARLREFLSVPGVERVNPFLRVIRCGGESLPKRLMEECLGRLRARLFQSYGPAETAVSVTCWECRRTEEYTHPPIGRPNPGTVLMLLDGNGLPVPPGTTGELFIGGAQVGIGYLNQPALTTERFVEDPLGVRDGMRFYRSGDLCRCDVDGELLFMGRTDDQVKVRGVRIEPGEVAAALAECPGVAEAFVFAEPDEEGAQRLVACLVADGTRELRPRDIVRQSSARIPLSMLPSRFHRLDALPLNRHGKVDREALVRLCRQTDPLRETGTLPIGATETAVAGIWSSMLGMAPVFREDDFFTLGGHSLKALHMLSSVAETIGAEVGLRELYEAPTLSGFSNRIESLRNHDRETGEEPVPQQNLLPVSPVQRRIWMLQRMFDQPSAFLVTRLVELPAHVTTETVRRTLKSMQNRHAILRTRIVMQGDRLLQQVEDSAECILPLSVESSEVGDPIDAIGAMRSRSDLLPDGGLWRAAILDSGQRRLLYLIFHHAAVDEWSMDIFLRETEILLQTGGGSDSVLPRLGRQYSDFTLWHNALREGGRGESMKAFWSDRLSDLSGIMKLAPDRVMPQGVPGRIGRIENILPADLSSRLRGMSEREGPGVFTLLLTAFHVLLHRWSGESDIVVGTPVSLRRKPEWQGLLGCFLNTVPIRMEVGGDESFLALAGRMKSEVEQALIHSELPFADISACAGGTEQVPFKAFLQTMFTVTGLDAPSRDAGMPTLLPRPMESFAVDDLSCLVDVSREDWRLVLKFDADRFEEGRMRRMAETFHRLLDGIAKDPTASLSSHPLVEVDPSLAMTRSFSGTASKKPESPSIDGMFSAQCRRTPDSVAIEDGDLRLTYMDLERRSDRMAWQLVHVHGIGAGDVVAAFLPTGALQVACLIACWKAGASVVPIDPELPEARVLLMLSESGASAVLTESGARGQSFGGLRVIDAAAMASEGGGSLPHMVAPPSRPAYCMFTSGSTGNPKGVFNTHAGFVNMCVAVSSRAGIGKDDRVLQYSTPTFDVSLFETFTALFNGARLVIAGRTEITALPEFMSQRKVTVAMLTPLAIGLIDTETLCRLRVLFTGGEEARPSDMARLCGRVNVFNIYGPTECSVWSTLFAVPSQWDASRKVPIGRPIDGVTVRILDSYGHPVPPGMDGEMHVSGIGVGLGYIGDVNTASSGFHRDPSDHQAMVYRTGDMGRWTEDGDILFCGRRDAQVKVMGVRIETEEVRSALERLPEIRQAFVTVRRRNGTEPVMIAFVVMQDGRKPHAAELRDRLAERLPSYMLPTRIHGVEAIPKTRHGKTDRARLEEFDEAFLVLQESRSEVPEPELPLGRYETRLASIWSELLGVHPVGREDGFFDLGGDSIRLIRLMEAVRSEWGIQLGISRVYSHLSLRSMAETICSLCGPSSTAGEGADGHGVVAVWDPPGGRNVFVMVGGAGTEAEYTKYHRMGRFLGDGHRLLVLPDAEVLSGRLPRRRLGELVEEYVGMILREQPKGPYRLMGDCLGGIDAFAVACRLQQTGQVVASLVLLDTLAPMTPVVRSMVGEGLGAYASLPERRHPMRQAWFRFRMSVCVATRGWWHPVPGSRSEVFDQALGYGLFDPSVHARECPVFEGDPEERFVHYISQGHVQRIASSGTFNAYRYKKNVPAFDIRSDNPVLHALLIGMRSRYVSGKVLHYKRTDNRRSDTMAARSFLRRELFHPGVFRGDVHVVMSSRIHSRKPSGGWERHTAGNVLSHRTEGDHRSYLGDLLRKTSTIIKDILEGVSGHGTSRGDAQDRRGLRSGGLQ